jgi:hypothetical protein
MLSYCELGDILEVVRTQDRIWKIEELCADKKDSQHRACKKGVLSATRKSRGSGGAMTAIIF